MGILEIFLISIGLAMDAFAVSVCKGLSIKNLNIRKTIIIALYFGIFQALMPALGYLLGHTFQNLVTTIDHWVAFVLLLFIGGKMIKDSFTEENDKANDNVDFKSMIILAIATSIDALAVGITFAFLNTNLINSISIIGIVTFVLSLIGVNIGNKFGNKLQNKAELIGGIILIAMGLKILLEHLEILEI